MKIIRSIAVSVVLCCTGMCFFGCMKTVTAYRTETKPQTETRYRETEKPEIVEVTIPYEEEKEVPDMKMVKEPIINPERKKMKAVVLPFIPMMSASTQNGRQAMELIKSEIAKSDTDGNVFLVVSDDSVCRSLGINSSSEMTKEMVQSLFFKMNVNLMVSGLVKKWQEDEIELNLDVTSLQRESMKSLFRATHKGNEGELRNWIKGIFFGKFINKGYKKEVVTTYKKETRTVMKKVKEPYQVTTYNEVRVPYETKVIDWGTTIVASILLLVLANGSSE